jgi:L-threonylcarbamoyladenylate synthase
MSWWHLQIAARILRSGGIVVHATEGVWGLACDPFDGQAVGRVLALKQRSTGKGLILIGADPTQFAAELGCLSVPEQSAVLASWPGPETWIVPNRTFPAWITGGRDQVAVRVPGHVQARALCEIFGGPLVSTSANLSGQAPPVTELGARARYFGSRRCVDYLLPGQVNRPGVASRIRSPDGRVLRA